MPPTARPAADRARSALARLDKRGGAEILPDVLTSRDATPLLGRSWFMDLLRRQQLPGVQIVPCGVWRCSRETFIHWLRGLRDG